MAKKERANTISPTGTLSATIFTSVDIAVNTSVEASLRTMPRAGCPTEVWGQGRGLGTDPAVTGRLRRSCIAAPQASPATTAAATVFSQKRSLRLVHVHD